MRKLLIVGLLTMAGASFGSSVRDLTRNETSSLNWLLQCPRELSQIMQQAQWIGSGRIISDRPATMISYRFFRQVGFTETEYVATLNVARIRRKHPVQDAPNYRVQCKITRERFN